MSAASVSRLAPRAARSVAPAANVYAAACAAIALGAFGFNWLTGHRGVFLLDQSIVFDGGWRILQGQIPYRDFFAPFGPVVFWIQALFFRIFGVNWTATVLPACALNTLAALSAMRIARLLGGSRVLAVCAGAWTAVAFQAPFGTLWIEQSAMFFDLVALQAAVESLGARGRGAAVWQGAAGALLAVAALAKQNYGLFFAPVVMAVLVAGAIERKRRWWRAAACAGAGFAAAMLAFFGWLAAFSDARAFVERVIVVGGEIGRSRLTAGAIGNALTLNVAPNLMQIDIGGMAAAGVALLLTTAGVRAARRANMAPACAAAVLLPFFRSAAQATTANEWPNSVAFAGLAACLGVSVAAPLLRALPRPSRVGLMAAFGAWAAIAGVYEGWMAWTRRVQEFPPGATFREEVRVKRMEGVRWGEPGLVSRTDFEAVAAHLSRARGGFFVMGDSTMLYGLLGVRPPQPVLYFQPAHCFLEREIPALDAAVAASLERSGVSMVVREKETFLASNRDVFPRFVRTWTWVHARFRHTRDFGIYEIWERDVRPGISSSAAAIP